MKHSLKDKIAVVAGATRGAGRGIACMLGEAGATVFCTGRSVRGQPATAHRNETIEETAEMVDSFGGTGIPVRVDHTDEEQVKILFKRISNEYGRLDILVNDVWGGDELTEWGRPFWELDLQKGLLMMQRAVFSHIITSRYGVPLMIPQKNGIIFEITDAINFGYRSQLFYDLVKFSVVRLAFSMAEELRSQRITAVAVSPGFLRSEAMLDHFGVSEANWQEGAKKDSHFIASETPYYIGRAVAAVAADPNKFSKTGKVLTSWALAEEYNFSDMDGRKPNWGKYFNEHSDPRLREIRDSVRQSHQRFLESFYVEIKKD